MLGILLSTAFCLMASSSSVMDEVKVLLVEAEATLATFKTELVAEDAKKVVKVFDDMVKIDAALQQAIVLLEQIHASKELEAKVQHLIGTFDSVVPHAEADRSKLIADILDKNKGEETMKRLLNQLKK